MAQSPLFNFTQLGLGIETALATIAAPTLWVSATDVDFHATNEWDARGSARGNIGQEEAQAGVITGAGSFTLEADPDLVGPMCALALGAESVLANPNNASATPLAYDHTYTLGIPRKTFTAQQYRRTDTMSYLGNKIGTMEWIIQPRQLVQMRFASTYINEQNTSSPAVASYSALKPYRFIDPLNTISFGGSTPVQGLVSASISIATGLVQGEIVFGSGRQAQSIPEGQSRVTASAVMQFNSQQAQQRFWGALGATSPQSDVSGFPVVFTLMSRSNVNTNVPYKTVITLPNVKISMAPTPGRTGGVLQQTLTIECFESAPQANDDMTIVVTNANSAVT